MLCTVFVVKIFSSENYALTKFGCNGWKNVLYNPTNNLMALIAELKKINK